MISPSKPKTARGHARDEFTDALLRAKNQVAKAQLNKTDEGLVVKALDYLLACAHKPEEAFELLAHHLIAPLTYDRQKQLWAKADQDSPQAVFSQNLVFDSVEHKWQRAKGAKNSAQAKNPGNWCEARRFLKKQGMGCAHNARQVSHWLDEAAKDYSPMKNWRGQPIDKDRKPLAQKDAKGLYLVPQLWLESAANYWKQRQRKTSANTPTQGS